MRTALQDTVSYLTAGTTLAATVISDTFTPNLYSLQYRFRRGLSVFDHDATGDTAAGTWSLSVSPDYTADLDPGPMLYVAYATDTAGNVYEVESGAIPIRGNPARITREAIILDAIVAVIEGRADEGQATIAMGDVQLQHMTPDELARWEGMYRERVNAQERRMRKSHGLSGNRTIHIEFNR